MTLDGERRRALSGSQRVREGKPHGGHENAEQVAPSVMAGPRGRGRSVPGVRRDAAPSTHDCAGCGRTLPLDAFPGRRNHDWRCPDCRRAKARAWDRANRERETARRQRLVERRRARVRLLERVLARLAYADPSRFAEAVEEEAGDLESGLRHLGVGDPTWKRRT